MNYLYDIEVEDEIIEEDEVKEYEIDFETGSLTGEIVYGTRAIAMWAWMALQVEKEKFAQYSESYGFEYEKILGQAIPANEQTEQIQNLLEECLLVNDCIEAISELTVEQIKNKIKIIFLLETVFGDEEISIDV